MANKGAYTQAANLLETGCSKLLEHKQMNAGGELALKLIECFDKGNFGLTIAAGTVTSVDIGFNLA